MMTIHWLKCRTCSKVWPSQFGWATQCGHCEADALDRWASELERGCAATPGLDAFDAERDRLDAEAITVALAAE